MALIKCAECGKEISDTSKICIHCGCPIEKELTCSECGKKVGAKDKVCKNCGCKITKKIQFDIQFIKEKKFYFIGGSVGAIVLVLFIIKSILTPNIIGTWKSVRSIDGTNVFGSFSSTYTFYENNECEEKFSLGAISSFGGYDGHNDKVKCKYYFNFWGNKIKINNYDEDGNKLTKEEKWESFEKEQNNIYIDNVEYTRK